MQIRLLALAAALLALIATDALARVKVTIDFDKTFDFKQVKTWGWAADGPGSVIMARTVHDDPEAMKKFAEPPIVDAVTTAMTRLGLSHASAGPDLIVTYYLLLSDSMSAQTVGQFLPATSAWGLPYFPQATQSLKYMNQGSLVIDLTANKAVVWRGVARAQIKPDAPAAKRESLVREAVRDLLKRYPPKQ